MSKDTETNAQCGSFRCLFAFEIEGEECSELPETAKLTGYPYHQNELAIFSPQNHTNCIFTNSRVSV